MIRGLQAVRWTAPGGRRSPTAPRRSWLPPQAAACLEAPAGEGAHKEDRLRILADVDEAWGRGRGGGARVGWGGLLVGPLVREALEVAGSVSRRPHWSPPLPAAERQRVHEGQGLGAGQLG